MKLAEHKHGFYLSLSYTTVTKNSKVKTPPEFATTLLFTPQNHHQGLSLKYLVGFFYFSSYIVTENSPH